MATAKNLVNLKEASTLLKGTPGGGHSNLRRLAGLGELKKARSGGSTWRPTYKLDVLRSILEARAQATASPQEPEEVGLLANQPESPTPPPAAEAMVLPGATAALRPEDLEQIAEAVVRAVGARLDRIEAQVRELDHVRKQLMVNSDAVTTQLRGKLASTEADLKAARSAALDVPRFTVAFQQLTDEIRSLRG